MGNENRKVYRREVSDVASWREFSVPHVAFALHRITGWVLLVWVGYHLALPAFTGMPTSVQPPGGKLLTVALLSVLFFHGINGIRLLVNESLGLGISSIERLFKGTVAATAVTAVVTWVVV
jgi:succinate dehydrogenase / fumarate reductase cytochrome b subunit